MMRGMFGLVSFLIVAGALVVCAVLVAAADIHYRRKTKRTIDKLERQYAASGNDGLPSGD